MSEMTPEERTAQAMKQREEGDPRPVSQIEAENLAAEQSGQAGTKTKQGKDDESDSKAHP